MSTSPSEFLNALRSVVARSGAAEWLAGRVDGDSIVVLFRQLERRGSEVVAEPVEGTRLQFEAFAQEVLGSDTDRLEDVLLKTKLEIVEPHEPGQRLQVS